MSDRGRLELLKAIEEEKKRHANKMKAIEVEGAQKVTNQNLEYNLKNINLQINNFRTNNDLNNKLDNLKNENKRLNELNEIKRKRLEEENKIEDDNEDDNEDEQIEENNEEKYDIPDYSSSLNELKERYQRSLYENQFLMNQNMQNQQMVNYLENQLGWNLYIKGKMK